MERQTMEEIWVREDGTVTDEGDPLASRFVAGERYDEILAQNEWLRADFMRVVGYYPWPGQRTRMERRVASEEPARLLAELRASTVGDLRFPVMLRKMWSGGEVQAWLSEQADRLRCVDEPGRDAPAKGSAEG